MRQCISVYLPIEIKEEQGLGLDILLSGQRDSVQILTSSSSDTENEFMESENEGCAFFLILPLLENPLIKISLSWILQIG